MQIRDLNIALGLPVPAGEAGEISGVASLVDAGPEHLAALFNGRYRVAAESTRAGAVLVTPALAHHVPPTSIGLVTEDARTLWLRAIRCLHPGRAQAVPPVGRHPSAVIDVDAEVHPAAHIGPLCVIEAGARIGRGAVLHGGVFVGVDALIGDEVELLPHTVVLDTCEIGSRTRIGPSAVIGGPGFAVDAEGPVPHLGRVRVGAGVTIGANACVDRGLVGDTVIGDGAHLDNLVQIGHGAVIGPGAIICGQAGVAGSAALEAGVVVGGQAGIADHVRVAGGVRVAAQSGVTRDLENAGDYSGHPAEPNRARLQRMARLKRLVDP